MHFNIFRGQILPMYELMKTCMQRPSCTTMQLEKLLCAETTGDSIGQENTIKYSWKHKKQSTDIITVNMSTL